MADKCVFRPVEDENNNPQLFDKIKGGLSEALLEHKKGNKLAYDAAWQVYGLALSQEFRDTFKDSLQFDEKGFPTYESLMKNPLVQASIGEAHNAIIAQRFPRRDNTRANYSVALEEALNYNTSQSEKIAIIEEKGNTLVTRVVNRDSESMKAFQRQYAEQKMADSIVDLLKPLGIEIGDILGEEALIRNGKLDFNKATEILAGTKQLLMATNNARGTVAISEEFAHLLVGTIDSPLIKRAINMLSNSPEAIRRILGDEYEANLSAQHEDMDLLAEEALGKLLQKHLIDNKIEEEFPEDAPAPKGFVEGMKSLLNRLLKFIQSKLRGAKPEDIDTIINNANNAMSKIARDINEGVIKIDKRSIAGAKRNAVFNSLAEQVDQIKEVLAKAEDTEQKRHKISRYAGQTTLGAIEDILVTLSKRENPNVDDAIILYDYLKYAIDELKVASEGLNQMDRLGTKQKFQAVLRAQRTVDSFTPLIDILYQMYGAGLRDSGGNYLAQDVTINTMSGPVTVNLWQTIEQLHSANELVQGSIFKLGVPAFSKFVESYVGTLKDADGNVLNIEELVKKKLGDISLWDRWLVSMANSSDELLQAFEEIQRTQNDKARENSIRDIRRVQAWQAECEENGIKDFEWMFEKDKEGNKTGYYIQETNYTQFYKDLAQFNDELEAAVNNGTLTADQAIDKKREWLARHVQFNSGNSYGPNPTMYHNSEWDRLSAKQKEMLGRYLEMKESFDQVYPPSRVSGAAIQIRRDGVQRGIDLATNPSRIWASVKESWRSFGEREDDDVIYGTRAIQGFDGRQFDFLPILYNNKLKDPNEISTDVGRALIAYAVSSNQYAATSETLDALEVGRMLVNRGARTTEATEVGKPVEETYMVGEKKITHRIKMGLKTNAADKLNEWFDCQVYQKRYAREMDTTFFGKRINGQEVSSAVMELASTCQLAFNWIANTANVLTGIGMTNIEVAACQFFNPKDLAKADAEYVQGLPKYIAELNAKHVTSKLGLFCELFNVKYSFDNVGHMSQKPSALQRFFGKTFAYLGQEGGDHWLYTRISIAMAKHKEIQVPDGNGGYKVMSVWDALQIEDSPEGHGLKEMHIPSGSLNMDGTAFSVGKFSRQMGEIHKKLFGVYNLEDRVAAQRHIVGKLMLMYRQWIVPAFNMRFRGKTRNQVLDVTEEGYYLTMARLMGDVVRGRFNLMSKESWDSLEDWEKQNIRRACVECMQTLAVWMLANVVAWPDDKDRSWILKFAELMAKREYRELGNLTPSLSMLKELEETVKSPTAVLGIVDPILGFGSALTDPLFFFWKDENAWNNELQSGPYKGHSTLYKRFKKLPVPIIQWYNQVDRFTGSLDDRINYYARTQY